MPDRLNFLLAKGERLTEPVRVPPGGGPPSEKPYTFAQAQKRLLPMVNRTADAISDLDDRACPHDEAVGTITIHPEYIAKSYFPSKLLRRLELRTVGSRPQRIKPERLRRGKEPENMTTTQLFVAGKRQRFSEWAENLGGWTEADDGADELPTIEAVSCPTPEERVKPLHTDEEELLFEVVLHATELPRDNFILEAFAACLEDMDLKADLDKRLYAGGLCFLQLEAPRNKISDVAKFSFLRVARKMPKLRSLRPIFRGQEKAGHEALLPNEPAINPDLRVAVFDGGLPDSTPLTPWARSIDPPGIDAPVADGLWHGQAVTSALLFGTLRAGEEAQRPFACVDHYRVFDVQSENDPHKLYDVLKRILDVLSTTPYRFINLSIGPALPVEDDEVHAWTSALDDRLADGNMLATIAVGNNGEADPILGLNRVQVPGDCVNGLSIGSCDSKGGSWQRASYSAVGPGRSPGIVKPDILAFGGDDAELYNTLEADGTIANTFGTSFAAPEALRLGTGVRAHFGQSLSPLAIKALLVHTSEPGCHPRGEIGWGRMAGSLQDVVVCPDGVVRVVYQGELTASKYLRAPIPLPVASLGGTVKITATFCFATAVDSAHPYSYTRSGLEIVFRPHKGIRHDGAMHPRSESFFKPKGLYTTEDRLRRDAHKWETCLHASKQKRGSSLDDPVFDIHYISRQDGQRASEINKINYVLVTTIESPKTPNLYDMVWNRYRTYLEPLNPTVQVPVVLGQ